MNPSFRVARWNVTTRSAFAMLAGVRRYDGFVVGLWEVDLGFVP